MRLKLTEARMTQQLTTTLSKVYTSLQENGGTQSYKSPRIDVLEGF